MDKIKTIFLLVICRVVWLAAFIIFLGVALLTVTIFLQDGITILTKIREALFPGLVTICMLVIAIAGMKYETKLKKTL